MGMILGYDHVEGKHKVVCITPYSARGEYRILTLGSAQKTWTLVKTNHSHNDRHNACIYGRCINGVVYYKIFDHMYVCSMISFDFRSEKFDMIKLPQEYKGGMLINYEGKLASAYVSFNFDGGINLCILEDAKKHKWSYKYFTVLKSPYQSLKTHFHIYGITDAGEFIYVSFRPLKPFYIIYFDPKRNRFRQVRFEGTEHHKFMLSHG